ncbi:BnaA09g10530D [Brassica napus]|uniref:BnaA09g10530D protein n=1 Tax=Brassica napus TaxID=3708 RepID=A0A078HQ90_BRANA|nr:BnaA09g10530D [Brassica napus]
MHGENAFTLRYTEKEWIDGVEWEDEATKTRFLLSTLQIDYSHKFSLRYRFRS